MKPRCYFVTGTDTGVGKTLVTSALLLNARAYGRRAVGLKPVSAGCELIDGQFMNEDARALRVLSSVPLSYAEVNPVALVPAMAPHIAAQRAGVALHAAALASAVQGVVDQADARHFDTVLVEGAGGWLVPLNDRETMADLAVALGYPVILVVAMRLGCLNHALLTAAAIQSAGLHLAGWVANGTADGMTAFDDNVRTLEERLPALRLGTVPWLGNDVSPEQVNTWLDAMSLFGPVPDSTVPGV
ncbi:MAG: dethiobiotin synthase [Gammaproteobacteria bacterium]